MKKYSYKDVVNEFNKHPEYKLLSNEDEYVNCSTKMRYICLKHDDKGEQSIALNHIMTGRGCYWCGKERTIKSHIVKFDENHYKKLCEKNDFQYIDAMRKNGKIYINFYCNKHEKLGVQSMQYNNMERDIKGCQYCSGKNLPNWYIKQEIESKHPFVLLSEFKGMNKELVCHCKEHNSDFSNIAKYIFYDGVGCEKCKSENISRRQRKSLDDVLDSIYKSTSGITVADIECYKNYESHIPLICNNCGCEWYSPYHSIVINNISCPKCSIKYKGERKIQEVLDSLGVKCQLQYKIADCKDKRALSFDNSVFDKDNKLLGLVEYQGEQHYMPIEFLGGKKKFLQTQKRDKIKYEYCKKNNIPLLVIPYYEYNNIKDLVTNFVDKIS